MRCPLRSYLAGWPDLLGLTLPPGRVNTGAVQTRGVLRSQVGRAYTPLLVLVTPEQQTLVTAALAAGADGCLVLPVHAKELASGAIRVKNLN